MNDFGGTAKVLEWQAVVLTAFPYQIFAASCLMVLALGGFMDVRGRWRKLLLGAACFNVVAVAAGMGFLVAVRFSTYEAALGFVAINTVVLWCMAEKKGRMFPATTKRRFSCRESGIPAEEFLFSEKI